MNREQKAAVIDEVASQIEEAQAIFAVDYRGLSVKQAADLRGRLIEIDANLRVVKNTLTERAADKARAEVLKQLLGCPTALTFVKGDPVLAAKALGGGGGGARAGAEARADGEAGGKEPAAGAPEAEAVARAAEAPAEEAESTESEAPADADAEQASE